MFIVEDYFSLIWYSDDISKKKRVLNYITLKNHKTLQDYCYNIAHLPKHHSRITEEYQHGVIVGPLSRAVHDWCWLLWEEGGLVTTIVVNVDGVPADPSGRTWVCGCLHAGIVGSNHAEAWMSAAGECCVLSGRRLRIGLMTHSEESYWVWCVRAWFQNLNNEEA